jgi:hypothetical protein
MIFILFFLIFLKTSIWAQIGGRNVYDFLRLTPNARVTSLGGVNITLLDSDVNLAWFNPALLNDSMHKAVSINVVNYLSDITYGYSSFGYHFQNIGTFHAGIHYVNYGKMQETDELGNVKGQFSANDMAIVSGIARDFGNIRFGTNLKLLYSNIQRFNSFGFALDFGGTWNFPEQNTTIGLVLKNIGTQITQFNKNAPKSPLPFEIQLGITHKPQYLPLRFTTTLVQLQQYRLIQKDPNQKPQLDLSGNPIPEKKKTFDNIFRHFVFGGEFLISPNFRFRLGYNHLRHQELKSTGTNFSMAGWGVGFGLKIKKFIIDYGFGNYHVVGGIHSFSILTNLSSFFNRE